jgi:hypothetical protein
MAGDFRTTVENMHKELKVYDPTGKAWVDLFTEDAIREWIAALSLFQGTVQEPGGAGINVPEFGILPNLATMTTAGDKSLIGHYWTYTGSAGRAVLAADPAIGTDLKDTILQPGDWLQVANVALAGQPIQLRWVRVGGDLLAKSRGDLLYGLKTWVAGGWERGSVVVFQGDVYRATRDTTGTDPDPTQPNAPWEMVNISGGLKVAQTDSGPQGLPLTAPAGQVWIVLSSAQAGGKQALFSYDVAAGRWQELGGGGVPIDLSGGNELIGVGMPIGAIIAYAKITPPPGWLLCDGARIPPEYKELQNLCGFNVPDLRDQFIRGATTADQIQDNTATFPKRQDTTRLPRKDFVTESTGAHKHIDGSPTAWPAYGVAVANKVAWSGGTDGGRSLSYTSEAGAHTHKVTGGGDAETAPVHVRMAYIIKAADRFIRNRLP